MFHRVLNSQAKTITSAAFLLVVSGAFSRFLGLIRDRILAGRFGAGDELDMYYAAFQIPDFIYSVLFMGAITAAFLPVFTDYWHRDQKEAWHLTNVVLNVFLLILVAISIMLFIFASQIIGVIAPGFSGAKKEMTITLTRIMFLSPVFLGISNIIGAALQSLRRFFVYSLTPIMYNIGIIIGALLFVPIFGIYGLAFGVALGAIFHLLIQIPSVIFSGFRYKAVFDFYHEGLKKIFFLMIPRTIGLAANQINVVAMTAIASALVSGSIAVFNLAQNLYYFPVGLFGIPFATAAFPALSQTQALGQKKEFQDKFSATFKMILFLVVPLSFMIYLLRAQIVRLILGTGKFDWIDTRLTAASLGIFAISIFAQSLIPLVSRAFYAMKDTKTPMKIGVSSIILNIFLALGFVRILGENNAVSEFFVRILKITDLGRIEVIGLPLAFSMAAIFNFFLLIFFLKKKGGASGFGEMAVFFLKIILVSGLASLPAYVSLKISALFFDTRTFLGIFVQAAIAALVALTFFIIFAMLFKLPQLKEILKFAAKFFRR